MPVGKSKLGKKIRLMANSKTSLDKRRKWLLARNYKVGKVHKSVSGTLEYGRIWFLNYKPKRRK